jgi:hypothetical protein
MKTYELMDYCKDGTQVAIATTEAASLAEATRNLATMAMMVGTPRAFVREATA